MLSKHPASRWISFVLLDEHFFNKVNYELMSKNVNRLLSTTHFYMLLLIINNLFTMLAIFTFIWKAMHKIIS